VAHEEARVECGECGCLVHYANSVPAVSALVVDVERRVLLARRAVEPDLGLWDTPVDSWRKARSRRPRFAGSSSR